MNTITSLRGENMKYSESLGAASSTGCKFEVEAAERAGAGGRARALSLPTARPIQQRWPQSHNSNGSADDNDNNLR